MSHNISLGTDGQLKNAASRLALPAGQRQRYTSMRYLLIALLYFSAFACHSEENFPIPEGYVLQHLDPTDGKIAKPRDWFYASKGTPSGWMWTLSAEDSSNGVYETGLRIQMLVAVEKTTKRTTEDFAKNFLQQKRNSTKVLSDCPASDQGQFKRQCLEVIENIQRPEGVRAYHILYSVFWGKNLDMVVVNTFGAPEEKWEAVRPVSDVMAHVEVIGPNFGKGQ